MDLRESLWRRLGRRARSRRRRGVILALSSVFLVAMFGFAACAVDLGRIVLTCQQLQNAADAAALAAVLELKTADIKLDRAAIRDLARREAAKVAGMNFAGNRPVVLSDVADKEDGIVGGSHIRLGNRHYDPAAEAWKNAYEGDAAMGTLPLNAVRVAIAFDQPEGDRRRLDLYFAPVIGHRDARVNAVSSSHLTPRDLAFVLDISGSMSHDTGGGGGLHNYGNGNNLRGILFPAFRNLSKEIGRPMDEASHYETHWKKCTDASDGIFGDDASDVADFAEQEFGDAPAGATGKEYWNHWKWQAYCDWSYCNDDSSRAVSLGWNSPKNLNVVHSQKNVERKKGVDQARFSYRRYCLFLTMNGLVPAIRGQRFLPRDGQARSASGFGTMDSLPHPGTSTELAPQPSSPMFYPRPTELAGYDASNLFQNGVFTGVYKDGDREDMYVRPMCWVRRAMLHGIEAMIGDEVGQSAAFDQIGMVSFATFANREMELSNDLRTSLKVANSRLTWGAFQLDAPYIGNASTNIGMGLRYGIRMVKYSSRARSWTAKSIALLTDGAPFISPKGGFEADEIDRHGAADIVVENRSLASSYARHWAAEAWKEGITIHAIGVGDGIDAKLCKDIAQAAGGVYFTVKNLDQDNKKLNEIFVAIGKDKLGKLYAGTQ